MERNKFKYNQADDTIRQECYDAEGNLMGYLVFTHDQTGGYMGIKFYDLEDNHIKTDYYNAEGNRFRTEYYNSEGNLIEHKGVDYGTQ